MTPSDILFETDHFNVSEVKEHFINPCCFGEDLAEWLGQQLTARGITTGAPYQEDWGWELFAQQGLRGYFLGVTGYLREPAAGRNDGEWRIMVAKKRSMWDKLRGRNTLTVDEPILSVVDTILREHTEIRNVRRELISL
jgi:hypothetical protein